MKKRGVFLVVVFVLFILILVPLNVLAEKNCFMTSNKITVTKPYPNVVVDFKVPVSVEDVVFKYYPNAGDFTVFEEKSLNQVGVEGDSIKFIYNSSEEFIEKHYYSLYVKGSTREKKDKDGNVIENAVPLEECKLFYVDFGPLSIVRESPESIYFSDASIPFVFSTNRRSVCKISSKTQNYEIMDNMKSTGEYKHTAFFPGKKNFFVGCKDTQGNLVIEEFEMVFDSSPPPTPAIDDSSSLKGYPEKTNKLEGLRVRFLVNDTESGVDLINYTIVEKGSGRYLTEWTTTSSVGDWIFIDKDHQDGPLVLKNGFEYKFIAKARNRAGLWSKQGESDGVKVEIGFDIEKAEDKGYLCSNGEKDQGEIYIDCAGTCPGCSNGHECEENSNCASGFCNPDDLICAEPSCSDGYLNKDESDVDCGGSCNLKCAFGKNCNEHSDCQSKTCKEGTCAEAACDDNILNGDETDIDCGGMCPKCESGKQCLLSIDCASGICDEETMTCKEKKQAPRLPPPTTDEEETNYLPLIIGIVALVGLLGGGGAAYYFYHDQIMEYVSKITGSFSSNQQPIQPQQVQQQPVQQPIQPQQVQHPQTQPQIKHDSSVNVASKVAMDLKEKEHKRKRENLFDSFGGLEAQQSQDSDSNKSKKEYVSESSSNISSLGNDDLDTDSDNNKNDLVSKEDIDNLFGGIDTNKL